MKKVCLKLCFGLNGARLDAFNWFGVGLDLKNEACWFKETLGFDSTN